MSAITREDIVVTKREHGTFLRISGTEIRGVLEWHYSSGQSDAFMVFGVVCTHSNEWEGDPLSVFAWTEFDADRDLKALGDRIFAAFCNAP